MGLDPNFVGGALAISSSIVNCFGTNIQKYSHILEAQRVAKGAAPTSMWKRPTWWVGMITMFVGCGLDFVGMGYANQSLVAALGGSTMLICNVFISYFWIGEELYRSDALGVLFVTIAAVIFALASPAAPDIDLTEIRDNFTRTEFEIYVFIQSFVVCIMLGTIANTQMYEWRASLTRKMIRPVIREFRKENRALRKRVDKLESEVLRIKEDVNELQYQAAEEHSLSHTFEGSALDSGVEEERDYAHWTDAYVYAATGGMIGAFAILFAGCVSKLLLHDTEEGLESAIFYAVLGGMVVCLIWQIKLLNSGLETGDVMVVLPVFQAFWITFGVISGIVFYHHGAVSLIGLVFVILGVMFFLRHGRIKADRPPLFNVPAAGWLGTTVVEKRRQTTYGGLGSSTALLGPDPKNYPEEDVDKLSQSYQRLEKDADAGVAATPNKPNLLSQDDDPPASPE